MDSEVVRVTLIYHVMAENSFDALEKVHAQLKTLYDQQASPYNLKMETITATDDPDA